MPPGPPAPQAELSPRERVERLKVLAKRAVVHWKITSTIIVLGCIVSVVVALRVKLIYKSEATILFKPAIHTSDRPDEESPSDRAQRIGAKLKDVLMTRTRLESIIKQYDLYPKTIESRGLIEAVGEMTDHVGFRGRDSETYVISFENEVPETAQVVAKALADSMITEFTKSSLGTAQQEAEFLGQQEKRSADELQAANKALATFLTMHPEFALEAKTTAFGPGAGTPMQPTMPLMPNMPANPAQTMGDPQLAALYRQKARLEAEQKNDGKAGPTTQTPGGGPASPDLLAKLTVQRDDAAKNAAAAAADLAEKRTHLTDEHPDVISAKMASDAAARTLHQAELALASARSAGGGNPYDTSEADTNVDKRIAQINGAIAARQDAVRRAQASPSADGGASIAGAIAETSELVQLETEWQRLLSTLKDTRGEHEDLKQKLERAKLSANAAESSGGDRMMVIDPAYLPMHPSKGGRSKVAMMGGILSVILALAYAFGRVFFNDTIIDSADVEAMHLIPVLGVLPKVRPPGQPGPAQPAAGSKEMSRVG
jgi:uncharacterized protein involved in exopolysaccharide biosynthesis